MLSAFSERRRTHQSANWVGLYKQQTERKTFVYILTPWAKWLKCETLFNVNAFDVVTLLKMCAFVLGPHNEKCEGAT